MANNRAGKINAELQKNIYEMWEDELDSKVVK